MFLPFVRSRVVFTRRFDLENIDLHAIVHNAEFIKRYTDTQVCAVVKSDAYGHDAERVARVLRDVVDCFAVANLREALQISQYVCKILILLPVTDNDLPTASAHGFVLAVNSFDTLQRYASSGLPLHIHIKTNSGMNRLGFNIDELCDVCNILNVNKQMVVDGVFSHMWGSAYDDCKAQYDLFAKQTKFCEQALNKKLIRHVANTSAVFCDKTFCMDMVRVGLALYGYGHPSLISAKSVSANVIAVRRVDKGDVVGYGGVFHPDNPTNLAVLDTGYASGFPRTMVGSIVSIDGMPARVVAVCMGMTICATPRLANVGSKAILLGKGVNPSNDETIVYELLCNLR